MVAPMFRKIVGFAVLVVIILYWYKSERDLKKTFYFSDQTSSPVVTELVCNENCNKEIRLQKIWTYRCINGHCVRKHFTGEKYASLQTCSMLCGPPNVWPMPSKIALSTTTTKFSAVTLEIGLKFNAVSNLLSQAFDVFKNQLRKIRDDCTQSTNSE